MNQRLIRDPIDLGKSLIDRVSDLKYKRPARIVSAVLLITAYVYGMISVADWLLE